MIYHRTRSEVNNETIEKFLVSTQESTTLKLYGNEIKSLPKKYPEITITKGERYRGELYDCLISKK